MSLAWSAPKYNNHTHVESSELNPLIHSLVQPQGLLGRHVCHMCLAGVNKTERMASWGGHRNEETGAQKAKANKHLEPFQINAMRKSRARMAVTGATGAEKAARRPGPGCSGATGRLRVEGQQGRREAGAT